MSINTDYAQLQLYGQISKKCGQEVAKTPALESWPELVKKNTIRPHWHSRLKAKAKL